MNPVKIAKDIYWVGAIDWAIEDFHGYSTPFGSTYNAYLILADKVTLIDTVKAPFVNELLTRISKIIEPSRIDYIVSNHSEMDHSGGLPQVMEIIKPEKFFCSVMGEKALKQHFHHNWEVTAVKSGDSIDLGGKTLQFLETRMLHWPDSMFSYLPEQKILFSNDAFGMHLASDKRFDDEVPGWEPHAAKYYANIILPYSRLVLKLLSQLGEVYNPLPEIIAPDHGLIWRKDLNKIITLYRQWAEQKRDGAVIITYDTMWQSTAKMAKHISEGLISEKIPCKIMALSNTHRSDIITELLNCKALLVGSPTMNNNIFPTVADLLCYVEGLRPKNLSGAAFGSYGWSGEAVKLINKRLEATKITLLDEGLKCQYVPSKEDQKSCFEFGKTIAKKLK